MPKITCMMPYDMHVYESNTLAEGPKFIYPKTGNGVRIVTANLGSVHGPELWYETVQYLGLEEFPEPHPDVFYIVPLVSALAARTRTDLLSPYKKVRDATGRIVGCRHLQRVV